MKKYIALALGVAMLVGGVIVVQYWYPQPTAGGLDGNSAVGVWRSANDPDQVLEVRGDGTVLARSLTDSDLRRGGTWHFIDPAKENIGELGDVTFQAKVLKVEFNQAATIYYELVHANGITVLKTLTGPKKGGTYNKTSVGIENAP